MSFTGACFLLLSPVALVAIIAPSDRGVDPYHLRRARWAAVGFPLVVLALHGVFQMILPDPSANSRMAHWSIMAWFFAGNYVYLARIRKPVSDIRPRSASLKARHRDSVVPLSAWLIPATSLIAAAVWIISVAHGRTPLFLLASAAAVLVAGPWLSRRVTISPEPLDPVNLTALQRVYRKARWSRAWIVFSLVTVSVTWKAAVAVVMASNWTYSLYLSVSPMLGFAAVISWLIISELRYRKAIRSARS